MTLNLLESSSLTAARFKTTRHRMRYIVLKLLLTQGQLETWKGNNCYHSIASKAFNYDSIQGHFTYKTSTGSATYLLFILSNLRKSTYFT